MNSNSYYGRVYTVTCKIPFGRVSTYGAIADYLALGSARMVGWALNKCAGVSTTNVPAHRVVNRKGELSGRLHFTTPDMMQALLENEGVEIKNHQVQNFDELFWHPGDHL